MNENFIEFKQNFYSHMLSIIDYKISISSVRSCMASVGLHLKSASGFQPSATFGVGRKPRIIDIGGGGGGEVLATVARSASAMR